ncbi:glycoside hydrolase family 71 protein [Sparassis latifolia]|uniref:Glucan endo-1,3-alpha-glucosidase agn1 n=1 Tax=Sparassis crispa TaxID=139825 RepID=A0A401GRS6_9APHY|nr:Glucan endo-1,3-alpha-glucosidase agn1 [Sparassis crispa]GBE84927.1 Glucan endo-1,3-alpha-glucosidase agn1 [Sparassis crispa]
MRTFALVQVSALVAAILVSAVPSPYPNSPFRHRSLAKKGHVPRQSTPKYVVAHHMVGNTYPYTVTDWANDIALASASGLDGFALNVGSDVWQSARVADAYQAAANSGTGFKLFLSFDMSSLPCSSPDDAQALRNYITSYATNPNQLTINGQVFASTFSGETCTFGQGSVPQGWSSQFTSQLTGQNSVMFVPSFFVDPSTFSQYDGVMDGYFNWNGGWPIELTTNSVQSTLGSAAPALGGLGTFSSAVEQTLNQSTGIFSTDAPYLNGLNSISSSSKTYIAAVSPWFFTHYGPNTYNKNWIYLADFHLYPTRWDSLIENRDSVDVVEVLTWNDYGESHYVGPIEGAQPNSQAWVNGFNHTGWLDMTSYYASAYKTGAYPNIAKDKLYMWARPHPKDANSGDSVPKPTNYELDQDTLWVVVMATAPGTVTLSTSNSNSQTFPVDAGVTKLSIPLTPGGYMHGVLERNGGTTIDLQPADYTFNPNPLSYNYNAYVAYASSG